MNASNKRKSALGAGLEMYANYLKHAVAANLKGCLGHGRQSIGCAVRFQPKKAAGHAAKAAYHTTSALLSSIPTYLWVMNRREIARAKVRTLLHSTEFKRTKKNFQNDVLSRLALIPNRPANLNKFVEQVKRELPNHRGKPLLNRVRQTTGTVSNELRKTATRAVNMIASTKVPAVPKFMQIFTKSAKGLQKTKQNATTTMRQSRSTNKNAPNNTNSNYYSNAASNFSNTNTRSNNSSSSKFTQISSNLYKKS